MTHTVDREKTLGTEVNKIYKVEKFEDIPSTIKEKTIIDWGNMLFFSNGAVYEYNDAGDTIIRR